MSEKKKSHTDWVKNHTRDCFFQGRVIDKIETHDAEFIEASAGTVIFMHCMALHSSLKNKSTKPRRTLIISYRAADAYPI